MRHGMHGGRMLLIAGVTAFATLTAASATITASSTSIDFGDVVIDTMSGAPILITVDSGWVLGGANGSGVNVPFSIDFGTCGALAGPGSCVVTSIFTPTDLGPASGTLNVSECPLSGPASFCVPVAIALTGNGVAKGTASPSAIDFGSVLLGTTVWKPVTVTVNQNWTLDGASGTGLNAPFGFDFGTCGDVSGPATCTVNASFTPTTLGVASAITDAVECPNSGIQSLCLFIPFSVTGVGVTTAPPSVPEPATIAMFGLALAGLARRRKRA